MKCLHPWLAASFLLLLSSAAQAEFRVVTTTTDLADLASAIGGKHVSVESLCRGQQDPHYVQARPSYMIKLNRADLLIAVGLDLEVAWLPALIRGARNPAINPGQPGNLDASTGIRPLNAITGAVDRSQGDVHPRGNPHYWLDPDNARHVAQLIATRLHQLDPVHSADYRRALRTWMKRLDAAEARWTAKMAPLRGAKVVSYHATFNYFIEHFGLQQRGFVESKPGIPPSPGHLAQLVLSMRREGVRVVLHERYHDRSASDLVAKRAGRAVVLALPTSVDDGASDYIALIDHLVQQTAAHLGTP